MTHTRPTSGHFVRYDLLTTDPERAVAFYGRLFGWTARVFRVGDAATATFRSGEHDVCGLATADEPPSQWLPVLAVEDVDASVLTAGRLGGQTTPPRDGKSGHHSLSIVVDPTGARFCPVSIASSASHLQDAALPGHFCWSELVTTDPSRAAAFYSALLGWSSAQWHLGHGGRYWLFRLGDRDLSGMLRLPADSGRPSFWLPYVQVVSPEDTAALAVELGGTIVPPPGDVPGRGRSAVVEDPAGARIAVFALTVAA